jgi:hypothetical protein
MFDSSLNIHLNEMKRSIYLYFSMCSVQYTRESVLYSTATTKLKDPRNVTGPRLLASHDTRATTREPAAYPVPLSSLSTRRVYSTATTKHKDPRNVTRPRLLASHDTRAMAREQAAYPFHLPVRKPPPTPLQRVLPTPSCPISYSAVPPISHASQLSKYHRLSPLQSCPHFPLDSLST